MEPQTIVLRFPFWLQAIPLVVATGCIAAAWAMFKRDWLKPWSIACAALAVAALFFFRVITSDRITITPKGIEQQLPLGNTAGLRFNQVEYIEEEHSVTSTGYSETNWLVHNRSAGVDRVHLSDLWRWHLTEIHQILQSRKIEFR